MSNKNLFMKSAFPRAPLQNGVGRFIPQLQRLVIKFCKSHGGSRGIRDFIEQDLVDYAKNSPSVALYLKPRRHRCPVIVAEYLNGDRVWTNMHNKTYSEIKHWMEVLRTQQGDVSGARLIKYQYTQHPSVQGPWTPFLFKDPELNIAKLPDQKFGCNNRVPMTATEKLRLMFEQQKINEEDIKTNE